MRSWSWVIALTVTIGAVTACGGGGGGGGGGAFIPPAALTTTVKINGQAATAQSADQYAVNPGDKVEVTPTQSVSWTSSSSPAGITANGLASTPTQWSAQLINETSSPATYTVIASAGAAAANTKMLRFVVAGGDARNGSYQAYATSGGRFTLALNFDAKTYAFTGSNIGDPDASGSFSADPNESGTYVFSSSRITTVANTARFRVGADTIVGAFPFTLTSKTPAVTSIRPFIATRALIRTQADLDGVYNRFGINVTSTDDASQITQVRVSNGGTKLDVCTHNIIYPIAICPTITSYTVIAGVTPDTWQIVDGTGTVAGAFGIAPLGDGKVYLAAGRLNSGTETVFRVGVSDKSTWQTGSGHGSATTGSWGTVNLFGNNTSTRVGIATNGSIVQTSNTFYAMQVPDPVSGSAIAGVQGMRLLPGSGVTYFAMQGAGLFAIVGANNVAQGTNGYLQLSLMD